MKRTAFILALVVISSSLALCQTLVDKTFIVRAETSVATPTTGLIHYCVLVYPDGKYRLERSAQMNQSSPADNKVYTDTLPADNLKQLQSIVDDPKFAAIKTGEPAGGSVQDLDAVAVSVPREHGLQNMSFMTANDRKPYKKDLEPFMNWMKDVEKRKVPQAKEEKSNNCAAPQVGYKQD
jgi:hypothetical protein